MMQAAYSPLMTLNSPIKAARRANLVALTVMPQPISYTDMARAMGKPKMRSHLSNIGAGLKGMGDAS